MNDFRTKSITFLYLGTTTLVKRLNKYAVPSVFPWNDSISKLDDRALFDLLKSLYSDTNILSKYIPSLQKKL